MAHICNPTCLRGKDQEDHGLKPASTKVHETQPRKYATQNGLAEWVK
jgi:hypothetical protein